LPSHFFFIFFFPLPAHSCRTSPLPHSVTRVRLSVWLLPPGSRFPFAPPLPILTPPIRPGQVLITPGKQAGRRNAGQIFSHPHNSAHASAEPATPRLLLPQVQPNPASLSTPPKILGPRVCFIHTLRNLNYTAPHTTALRSVSAAPRARRYQRHGGIVRPLLSVTATGHRHGLRLRQRGHDIYTRSVTTNHGSRNKNSRESRSPACHYTIDSRIQVNVTSRQITSHPTTLALHYRTAITTVPVYPLVLLSASSITFAFIPSRL
jgi:hypothetical protein